MFLTTLTQIQSKSSIPLPFKYPLSPSANSSSIHKKTQKHTLHKSTTKSRLEKKDHTSLSLSLYYITLISLNSKQSVKIMSVAVCRSLAPAGFESILALSSAFSAPWLQQQQPSANAVAAVAEENYVSKTIEEAEKPPEEFDMWTSIQAQKPQEKDEKKEEPYVHPLMRRSSSLLSQKSLEICTESLGSETGSDDYFSSDDEEHFFSLNKKQEIQSKHESKYEEEQEEEYVSRRHGRKELATVNYHCCSISSRRPSPPRSFPPPLPSISRRDGPCLQMRPRRVDGRLVVEAVPVPSQNYLHAERHNGRLLLSFINTTAAVNNDNNGTENQELVEEQPEQQEEEVMTEEAEEEQEQEEEEEEVEVVDRGTIVEVKISTQPPQQNNGCSTAALKVHRSSIVINKFVSCTPITNNNQDNHHATPAFASHTATISPVRRLSTTTTTAAAAAVAASSLSASSMANDNSTSAMMDNKLLLPSRRGRNIDELLHEMRRCNQLTKPLFILEPCCIATSS